VLSDVMTTHGMQGSMCVSVERCRWIYARSYTCGGWMHYFCFQ